MRFVFNIILSVYFIVLIIKCLYYLDVESFNYIDGSSSYKKTINYIYLSEPYITERIMNEYLDYYKYGNKPIYSILRYDPYEKGPKYNFLDKSHIIYIPKKLGLKIYDSFIKKYPNDPYPQKDLY